jgi:hypothetical protein
MHYCPYCSGPISKPVKTCPHCHKTLDLDIYQAVFQSDLESTALNRRARRSLWLKEHSRIIMPLLFLLVGLLAGTIFTFGYAQMHFSATQTRFEEKINNLQNQIADLNRAAAQTADSAAVFTQKQDSVIQLLKKQETTLRKIIVFTRRLAKNSTITPKTIEEQDFFRRNVRYLMRLYDQTNEQLKALGFAVPSGYNLKPVPEFLNE